MKDVELDFDHFDYDGQKLDDQLDVVVFLYAYFLKGGGLRWVCRIWPEKSQAKPWWITNIEIPTGIGTICGKLCF